MGAQSLALCVLVMMAETYGVTSTVNYKPVFVLDTDVTVQNNIQAKGMMHCTRLYQSRENRVSLFLYDGKTAICRIGVVTHQETVEKTKINPDMYEFMAKHELLFGEPRSKGKRCIKRLTMIQIDCMFHLFITPCMLTVSTFFQTTALGPAGMGKPAALRTAPAGRRGTVNVCHCSMVHRTALDQALTTSIAQTLGVQVGLVCHAKNFSLF